MSYGNSGSLSGSIVVDKCYDESLKARLTTGTGSLYVGQMSGTFGRFDIHLDRVGNLRIFLEGEMVGEHKPK